jgi:hypothetical protein
MRKINITIKQTYIIHAVEKSALFEIGKPIKNLFILLAKSCHILARFGKLCYKIKFYVKFWQTMLQN